MNTIFKNIVVASATAAFLSSSAHAGGLSDAIVEREVQEIQEVAPAGSLPGWVIPVVALVVIGAVIAASNDDDPDPVVVDTAEEPTNVEREIVRISAPVGPTGGRGGRGRPAGIQSTSSPIN